MFYDANEITYFEGKTLCVNFQELSKQWKNEDTKNRYVENVDDDDDDDDDGDDDDDNDILLLWYGLPTKDV